MNYYFLAIKKGAIIISRKLNSCAFPTTGLQDPLQEEAAQAEQLRRRPVRRRPLPPEPQLPAAEQQRLLHPHERPAAPGAAAAAPAKRQPVHAGGALHQPGDALQAPAALAASPSCAAAAAAAATATAAAPVCGLGGRHGKGEPVLRLLCPPPAQHPRALPGRGRGGLVKGDQGLYPAAATTTAASCHPGRHGVQCPAYDAPKQ